MATKTIVLFCIQVVFLQLALGQICANRAAPAIKKCPYLDNNSGIYYKGAIPFSQDIGSLAKYCPYLSPKDIKNGGYSAQELDALSSTCPALVNLGLTYGQWAATNGYSAQDLNALVRYCPYLVNRGLEYDGSPALNSYAGVVAPALNVAPLNSGLRSPVGPGYRGCSGRAGRL